VSQIARLVFIAVASAWILWRVVLHAIGIAPLGWSIALPMVALWVVMLMYCTHRRRA